MGAVEAGIRIPWIRDGRGGARVFPGHRPITSIAAWVRGELRNRVFAQTEQVIS